MLVQQSASQRNQRIAARALYATVGVAAGAEIYGIFHQQDSRILTIEYGVVYVASFVLAFTFVWLTAKRNLQVSVTQAGLEISHDEDSVRFTWHDVKRVKPPTMLQRYWLFELNNTKRIKISTQYFSRAQIKQFNRFVTNNFANITTTKITANSNNNKATTATTTDARIVDSSRRRTAP